MRIIRRTIAGRDVAVGSDEPVAWTPLAEGSTLVSVVGTLHVIGPEAIPINLFNAYGVSAYVMPVIEPEATAVAKSVWDTMVPKAQELTTVAASEGIDYDWDTADAGPAIEPGELNPSALLGIGDDVTKEIMPPRLEFVTWANSRQGGWVAGSPDVFNPSDLKTFRATRRLTADRPSMAMIAVSSPSMTDVAVAMNAFGISGAAPWGMMENLREVIKFAMMQQLGMTEAGAESPFSDMALFIQTLIAPDMSDESSTLFNSNIWRVMCEVIWTIDLPGSSIPNTLDGR